MATAPHEILGIPASATPLEARAAYRRLALTHHPDHNPLDPAAAARFQKILRAYRTFRRRASGAAPSSPPRAPRPDRYGCASCGDSFPFPLTCPRCEVSLYDRSAGNPPASDDLRVQAWIAKLESRPEPVPSALDRLPVPGLLAAGSVAAAFAMAQVGPLGPALLFLGFAAYVSFVELHRRADLSFVRT